MKRFFKNIFVGVLIILSLSLCACGWSSNSNDTDDSNKEASEYIIQYSDDYGVYRKTVKWNEPYYIDIIPVKTGFDFLGLYDAEVDGAKYVTENGSSVSVYTDKKNIVLYPQWTPKEYSLVLDYQGAYVGGPRQLSVTYNNAIPDLPRNLELEHFSFVGWFTEPNCKGKQITDKFGFLPEMAVINERNFDLSAEFIKIYAGFETEKVTVTFYFEDGMEAEEIEVPYNTPIKNVVPETRVNGKAPYVWSKTKSGSDIFNGRVKDEMILYAIEYAPVIDFDGIYDETPIPVVALANAPISLPKPTRENYKFLYWQFQDGGIAELTEMPSESMVLSAVWQAKLVFDENGGSLVNDISVPAGDTVQLPVTRRNGFVFTGWYDQSGEKYDKVKMPSESVVLQAGWKRFEQGMKFEFLDINDKTQSLSVYEYNGHYYSLINQRMSWNNAQKYCEFLGGYQVSITSAEENEFVVNLLKSYDSGNYAYWIGATDQVEEGVWKWASGEEFNYANWHKGEPNNGGNQDFAGFYSAYTDYSWDDCADDSRFFILEWDNSSCLF